MIEIAALVVAVASVFIGVASKSNREIARRTRAARAAKTTSAQPRANQAVTRNSRFLKVSRMLVRFDQIARLHRKRES